MGRVCTICRNPNRTEIDRALLEGVSRRKIADRFGLSASAVQRHRKNDLGKALMREAEAEGVQLTGALLGQVRTHAVRGAEIMAEARASGDYSTEIKAMRECTRIFELIGKMTGELTPQEPSAMTRPMFILEGDAQVTVNIPLPEGDEKPGAPLSSESLIEAEATEVDDSDEESNAVQ